MSEEHEANGLCLLIEDVAAVRVLKLNRPGQLNALNTELTSSLLEAMHDAENAPDVRAVVLAGNGRAFCAGADVKEFHELTPENSDAVVARAELTMRTQMAARIMSKPVIAAVQGAAMGGGAGLALGADMMVVASDVTFGYPELRHSIVPALVMTGLRENLGMKFAFEMVSTGRTIDANTMLSLGLTSRIVARDDLMTAALEVAQVWTAANSSAMRATKELFYAVGDLDFEAGMLKGRRVNQEMREFRGNLS